MRWSSKLAFAALMGGPAGVVAQPAPLEIRLEHGSDGEARTRDQLLRLLREHDVERWIFTRDIVIDERAIPHSHPVLTLHTRHLAEDLHLLATFIHEQFHWLVSEREAETAAAIAELRERWPEVPAGHPLGGRDEYSTYVHLIVCDMELQGMERLVGRDRAAGTLGTWTHYTWIYERVLTDPVVREITSRHGFIVP